MKDGPDIARIASLVGDPARANMLTALMSGAALTASELALEAGVTLPTASSHLAKLMDGGLLTLASQGRHRYYGLASPQVAGMLEAIMGVAASVGPQRVRPGPKEATMREARVCYDHLAGDLGVALFDAFIKNKWMIPGPEKTFALTKLGRIKVQTFGVDIEELEQGARPLCRACLDWSVRRHHIAGALGAAILDEVFERGWATQKRGSRVLEFTRIGEAGLRRVFAFPEQQPS